MGLIATTAATFANSNMKETKNCRWGGTIILRRSCVIFHFTIPLSVG